MKFPEFRALAHFGYLAAAIIAGVVAWSLHFATTEADLATVLIERSADALQAAGTASRALRDAGNAHDGYLASRDPALLSKRDAHRAVATEGLAQMRSLTADNDEQQLLIRRARDLMAEWDRAEPDKNLDEQLAAQLSRFRVNEILRRDARRAERQRAFDDATGYQASVLGLFIALMIPGYLLFLRQSRARNKAERKLVTLAESLPGAIFQYRVSPEGVARYEFLSAGIERLRGVSRESALADPEILLETMFESDRKALFAAIKDAQETGRDVEHDYRIHRNGEIRWIRATAAQRKQADGSVVWSGLWRDVTEKRELQLALVEAKESAERSNLAKTTFVTTMSHEIRTPMNGVLGMLELIARTELNVEQQSMLHVVRDSGNSLLRVIDDILDFSKIEAGRLELAAAPASLAVLVESIFAVYDVVAREKGLILALAIDNRVSPAVVVDAMRLRQVLGNLVNNAVKFTTQGRVEIAVDLIDRTGGQDVVRFCVKDTGIGISPAVQKELFKPFMQAEAGTAQRFGGTGLGLAICERLVTLMGGAIGVSSELGAGTTMMVTLSLGIADPLSLPAAGLAKSGRDPAHDARRVAPGIAAAEAEGTLLLLVDDHPTNRMILLRQVNLLGYAAEVAENGLEALDKWRSGRFAMVITDCEMPEMDGYELARNIRAAEALGGLSRMPILACTAYVVVGEAQKCRAAGMDDYVSKPVDLKGLAARLAQWLPLPPPSSPVDATMLAEVCAHDSDAQDELLARFRTYNAEDAGNLRRACARGDLPQVAQMSHRMVGSGRTVGAMDFARACATLEHAARAHDATGVAAGALAFEREIVRLDAFFAKRGALNAARAP